MGQDGSVADELGGRRFCHAGEVSGSCADRRQEARFALAVGCARATAKLEHRRSAPIIFVLIAAGKRAGFVNRRESWWKVLSWQDHPID